MILYLIWNTSPITGRPALQGWKRRRKAAESHIKTHPGTYIEAFNYPGDDVPPFAQWHLAGGDRDLSGQLPPAEQELPDPAGL